MQQQQQTSTSNTYYNLVSVLYHSLQAAQAASVYIQDAQQSGNQQLVQYFQQYQQIANQQAAQAQQLLVQFGYLPVPGPPSRIRAPQVQVCHCTVSGCQYTQSWVQRSVSDSPPLCPIHGVVLDCA